MGKIGKGTNRNVLEYDVVWEIILQSMGKHMTNTYDSSEMKVQITHQGHVLARIYTKQEIMNNSAISLLLMPPHCSRSDHRTHPVPCVVGYSTLFDNNKDEVFTCMDLPAMDPQDVILYTTVEYPSRDNVSTF